jgi:hypothetical protein
MGKKVKESFVSYGEKKEKIWGFFCPACHTTHYCSEYNYKLTGTLENPNIRPVITLSPNSHTVCSSIILDGAIYFSNDCTHAFKNITVELPEWL